MTLRDLSKTQLYNLQRRCEKERKQWVKKGVGGSTWDEYIKSVWDASYNAGLKAGLSLCQPDPSSPVK